MNRLALCITLLTLLTACGSTRHWSALSDGNGISGIPTENKMQAVMSGYCVNCHNATNGSGTNFTYADNMNRLAKSTYVVPGHPESSILYQVIANGSMPPGGGMEASELKAVEDWIVSLAVAPTPPTPTPSNATFTYVNQHILQSSCVRCHGGAGGYSFSNYAETMRAVIAGDPGRSALYTSVASGRMPPRGSIGAADLKILSDWIQSGAPNN